MHAIVISYSFICGSIPLTSTLDVSDMIFLTPETAVDDLFSSPMIMGDHFLL